SLREVIPFPKTARAVDLMVNAPSAIGMAQGDELELLAAWPELSDREKLLAEHFSGLLDLVDEVFFGRSLEWNNAFQEAMAIILTKSYNDSQSSLQLSRAGYGLQAAQLCRSIVEGAANGEFIALDPEKWAIAFLKS